MSVLKMPSAKNRSRPQREEQSQIDLPCGPSELEASSTNLSRWFDSTVGKWLSEDPISFLGQDQNLSRYVKNGTPARTDPEGEMPTDEQVNAHSGVGPNMLPPWTEADARKTIEAEIAEWEKKGWDLAVNFFKYFLSRQGGTYTVTGKDKHQVMTQAQPMVNTAIKVAICNSPDIKKAIANCDYTYLKGASISYHGHVRWVPNPVDLPIAAQQGTFASQDLLQTCDLLFYAFGGADLNIEGTIRNVHVINSDANTTEISFSVLASVTITDEYTFEETNYGVRTALSEAYSAANCLQWAYKYPRFTTEVEYEQEHHFSFRKTRADN